MRPYFRHALIAPLFTSALIALACTGISGSGGRSQSDDRPDAPVEETVADLAAGRVVIVVVKDAVLVGTLANPVEADARVPTPVALSAERLGIILGAVRWSSPSSHQAIAFLDQELPHLRSSLVTAAPQLQQQSDTEAADIEAIGQALLERLSDVAQGLHSQVDLPEPDPLVQLILADYSPGYGPEVWQLSYGMKQEEERDDYWTTRVLHPSYIQFWPPEKGRPRTLVEFAYPPENAPPSLMELLRQKDPRLQKILSGDPKMAALAAHFLQGEMGKVSVADATQFLRSALDAIAPAGAQETIAIVREETGIEWVLAPPPEPQQALPHTNRPAGAPTLMGPPH